LIRRSNQIYYALLTPPYLIRQNIKDDEVAHLPKNQQPEPRVLSAKILFDKEVSSNLLRPTHPPYPIRLYIDDNKVAHLDSIGHIIHFQISRDMPVWNKTWL